MSSKSLQLADWHLRERLRAVMYTIDVYMSNGRWNGVDLCITAVFIISFSLRYALPINSFQVVAVMNVFFSIFTRESRMLSASLPSSGRLSVCHTRELYQNGAS